MGNQNYDNRQNDSDEPGDLTSYFDKSAGVVHDYTAWFERKYGRPGVKKAQTFFKRRPISAIFLAFFFALSILPVLTFLTFSLFTLTTFLVMALLSALIASLIVILSLLVILAFVLVATLFTSVILTVMTIATFLLFRFLVLVRQDGRAGISGWAGETKQHIIKVTQRPKNGSVSDGPAFSDGTNESIVIVEDSEPHLKSSDEDEKFGDSDTKVQG